MSAGRETAGGVARWEGSALKRALAGLSGATGGPEIPMMEVASARRDIVITWPQTRPLQSYLWELARADERDQLINYRVARLPKWPDAIEDHGWTSWPFGIARPRCWMVHSGWIRGWCGIVGAGWQPEGRVLDPTTGGFMRAGYYIVRDPYWHDITDWHGIDPIPMRGFQGWRWFVLEEG